MKKGGLLPWVCVVLVLVASCVAAYLWTLSEPAEASPPEAPPQQIERASAALPMPTVTPRKRDFNAVSMSLGSGSAISGASIPGTPAKDALPAGLLVEAEVLAKPRIAGSFNVIDVRSRDAYQAGHIPGAVWVDHAAWARAFAGNRDAAAWTAKIEALGFEDSVPLVIHDDGEMTTAAHIWWMMRYWGFEDVRLLNGGWRAWTPAGGSATRDRPVPEKHPLKLRPLPARLAAKDEIFNSWQSQQKQIIDCRPQAADSNDATRTTRNLKRFVVSDVVDAERRQLKPAATISKLFAAARIDPARPTIVFAQSAPESALMCFVLEWSGADHVRIGYAAE